MSTNSYDDSLQRLQLAGQTHKTARANAALAAADLADAVRAAREAGVNQSEIMRVAGVSMGTVRRALKSF